MTINSHALAFSQLAEFSSDIDGVVSITRHGHVKISDCREMVDAAAQDSYERGCLEGRAAALSEADEQLAQAEMRFAERLEHERSVWIADFSARLTDDLMAANAVLARAIVDKTALVLEPWLNKQLRDKAITELEHSVLRIIDGGQRLTVRGPRDLVERVQSVLGDRGLVVELEITTKPQLEVLLDDTVIHQNIDAWISGLKAKSA